MLQLPSSEGCSRTRQRRPTGPWNSLHDAAIAGSAEYTAAILAAGTIDIDQRTPESMTPLALATLNGHRLVVLVLLSNGADVSAVVHSGSTALHLSAQGGDLVVTEMLMEAGASLEATNDEGSTPLHVAAVEDHSEVVRALIEAGADINSRRPSRPTPLMAAACFGSLGAARELLRAGADPLLTSGVPGETKRINALDMAASTGHSAVVGELIQQRGIRGCGGASGGAEALQIAAKKQYWDVVTILVNAGAVDEAGLALIHAAERGPVASVKLLLRQQDNTEAVARRLYLNARDANGSTPLLYGILACRSCSPRIVRLLVEAGADTRSIMRVTNSTGEVVIDATPLEFAAASVQDNVVRGKDATKEQRFVLWRILRLLCQEEAVHAISWLWPSNASSIAQEGTTRTPTARGQLVPMLALIRQRARARHALWAAVSRHAKKE